MNNTLIKLQIAVPRPALLVIMLVTLVQVHVGSVLAQDSATDTADAESTVLDEERDKDLDQQESEQQVEAKKVEPKKESSKSKPNPKVFIPTEEISEDKPVPFPVDI